MKNKSMASEILLLYPPASQLRTPHLALPLLKSYLNDQQVNADIADVNIACQYFYLSKEELGKCIDKIKKKTAMNEEIMVEANCAIAYWENVRLNLDKAFEILSCRDEQFPTETDTNLAEATLKQAYHIISTAYFPTIWSEEMVKTPYDVSNCLELLRSVNDENTNPFISYFDSPEFARLINAAERKLIGVSLCFDSQLVAGFTMIKKLREMTNGNAKIIIGGPLAMFMRRNTEAVKLLFDWIDAIVYGEGELPLLQISEAIDAGKPISDVGGLILLKEDMVVTTPYSKGPKLYELPTPDFSDYPLDKYLSNRLELPVMSERGCYFGDCAFCCVDLSPDRHFDSRKAEQMVDDMRYFNKQYKATTFLFISTALPALKAQKLSMEIIKSGLKIKWGSNIRYEDRFTQDILAIMRTSGCIVLNVGLESGSEKMVALMRKGFTIDQAKEFHKRAAIANIRIGLYIMLGFPGETEEDRDETFRFLREMGLGEKDISISQFSLNEFAPIFDEPQNFGIRILERGNELPFQRNYEMMNGEDPRIDLVTPFLKRFNSKHEEVADIFLSAESILEMGGDFINAPSFYSGITQILSPIDGSIYELDQSQYAFFNKVNGIKSLAQIGQELNLDISTAIEMAKDFCISGILVSDVNVIDVA